MAQIDLLHFCNGRSANGWIAGIRHEATAVNSCSNSSVISTDLAVSCQPVIRNTMDATSQSFTQLADKSLTADIKIATWCPTMDLLALATADGQLCLHRLNWQRLWAVSPESAVTSLCWRPDGKVLACGHDDGFISLLNVENGEAQQRGKMVAGMPFCSSMKLQPSAPCSKC